MSKPVICIGAALVDELFYCGNEIVLGTSNPAVVQRNAGGVVRNIAHHLALLGVPVQLIAAVGNDDDGRWLLDHLVRSGIGVEGVMRVPGSTGKYTALIQPKGALFVGGCSDTCTPHIAAASLEERRALLSTARILVADTNINEDALAWLVGFSRETAVPLIIEPVSVEKAKKIQHIDLNGVLMITPNEDELSSLSARAVDDPVHELLIRGVRQVWLRRGAQGSAMHSRNGVMQIAADEVDVLDSTGAGDAALAGWITAWYHGATGRECLHAAHSAAAEVLKVRGAIAHQLTIEHLQLRPHR